MSEDNGKPIDEQLLRSIIREELATVYTQFSKNLEAAAERISSELAASFGQLLNAIDYAESNIRDRINLVSDALPGKDGPPHTPGTPGADGDPTEKSA